MRPTSIGIRSLSVFGALVLGACGQNRDLPPPGPLKAEWYLIEDTDRPAPGQFLRFAQPGPNGGGLDIAITDFDAPEHGPKIRLVGVVHVADGRYYERIQHELDACDLVLYEGVKPSEMDGARWQKEMLKTSGELGKLQQEIAEWFGFRYQMEAIDYARPNLVHADMSLEEFSAAGADRMGLVSKPRAPLASETPAMAHASPGTGSSSGSESFPTDVRATSDAVLSTWASVRGLAHVALGRGGTFQSLGRRMFAETMGTMDIGTSLDFVPGLSDLVLTKRNVVVMKVLGEELKRTSGVIAIFYGAAHMKDLAKRIETELGYRRAGGRWVRAWVVRPPIR